MNTCGHNRSSPLICLLLFLALSRTNDSFASESLKNPEGFIVKSAIPVPDGAREWQLSLGAFVDRTEETLVGLAGEYTWGLPSSELEIELEATQEDLGAEVEYLRSVLRETLGRPELSFNVGVRGEELLTRESRAAHLNAALLLRKNFLNGFLAADVNIGYSQPVRSGTAAGADGGFAGVGLSLPAGKTFHAIPSRRASLDRRFFIMLRVRRMRDDPGDAYYSPGLQFGFRMANSPRDRSLNFFAGLDRERLAAHGTRYAFGFGVTYVSGRGKKVDWKRLKRQ